MPDADGTASVGYNAPDRIRTVSEDGTESIVIGDTVYFSDFAEPGRFLSTTRPGASPTRNLFVVLECVSLIFPNETTFATAREIGPDVVRALDALHLAAALELGADLDVVVTYDKRLAFGCEALGVAVLAPGLPPTWWRA